MAAPHTKSPLRFGSDGYRGIIGDTFSWDYIARLTAGTAAYLRSTGAGPGAPIPIGYDTRFLAPYYARAVYHALREEGFSPALASTFCPSPYLSFSVKKIGAPMGVMITASHNPSSFLGYKLKGPEGGSALPEVTKAVEEFAENAKPDYNPEPAFSLTSEYEEFDCREEYAEVMRGYASPALADFPFDLTVDFVRGTTAYIYLPALQSLGLEFTTVHTERDPLFAGGKPEPVPEQLEELVGWVDAGGETAFGAAFDGDGDRLGLIDEASQFVPPEDIYVICLLHLVEDRGMSGRVVKSVSLSSLIDLAAQEFGLQVVEVPVGFKHSTKEMLVPGTLMAAEESGGFGFGFHLPERDALLALILILSAMAERKTTLRQLRESIAGRFGHPHFYRQDIPLVGLSQAEVVRQRIAALKHDPSTVGIHSARISQLDGLKFSFPEGFLLLRFSGTEPLVRIYCEHKEENREKDLVQRVKDFLFQE